METIKSNTEENKLCPCLFACIMVFLFAESAVTLSSVFDLKYHIHHLKLNYYVHKVLVLWYLHCGRCYYGNSSLGQNVTYLTACVF